LGRGINDFEKTGIILNLSTYFRTIQFSNRGWHWCNYRFFEQA